MNRISKNSIWWEDITLCNSLEWKWPDISNWIKGRLYFTLPGKIGRRVGTQWPMYQPNPQIFTEIKPYIYNRNFVTHTYLRDIISSLMFDHHIYYKNILFQNFLFFRPFHYIDMEKFIFNKETFQRRNLTRRYLEFPDKILKSGIKVRGNAK